MCGACERDKSSTMIQMYGQPYNQNTLKPIPPDETARLHRVRYLFISHIWKTGQGLTIYFCYINIEIQQFSVS